MSNIPIIGTEPQQPTFPSVGIQWLPNGAMLVIQLGPATSITQFIDAQSMDMITKQWKEHKAQQALIMQAVQNSRNN